MALALGLFVSLWFNIVSVHGEEPLLVTFFGLGSYCFMAATISAWSTHEHRDWRSVLALIAAYAALAFTAMDTLLILLSTLP